MGDFSYKKKNTIQEVKEEKTPEFEYIEDVNKEELKGKHIFIDPGKRSLFTMMNDDGKFL